ncbi:RNA-directed DNA polymerase, eukaryota [Tanacetum coccineum]
MGDTEWIEVKRKKHGSVFNRLKFPTYKASMADDLAKISLSVYVSNFPSHLTVRELWNICGKKGTLVDVFIAKRNNKLRQMFAFCRFIKVSDSDALINLISNIWIGKLRLHANVARYARKEESKLSHTVVKVVIMIFEPLHIHVLCVEVKAFLGFSFKYLGGLWVLFEFSSQNAKDNFIKHEGILSRFSFLKPWHDDFVVEERLIWLEIEGVPLRAWNKETFTHICSKWGEVLFSDDTDGCNRLSKWLCIKSSHASLVFATIMIPLNKVTYAIRVRELCSWTPSFLGEDSMTDDEDFMGKYEADKAELFKNKDAESAVGLENDIGDENIYVNNDQVHDECAHDEEPLDSDLFELDSLIKKRGGKDTKEKCSVTPDFPPGFSPNSHENQKGSVSCNKQEDDVSREHLAFSLVERLEETIKVGLDFGLNMEGCENTLASLIAGNGEIIVWVNSHFDFASTSARGMSGEIICKWNSLLFCKSRIVCNENYVVVEGLWIPNDVRLMWIVVYDPQNLPSVILEKGIHDHRPILLKEFMADYGPTPFRFFNSWLDMEGFHHLVSQTWHHDGIVKACGFTSLKKKLQNLKSVIRAWVASKKSESSMIKRDHESRLASIDAKVDQGCANEEDFINRRDSIKILDDIQRMEAKDLAQKAKVKWAIEGDENTSFFHGTLKKKRRQLAIKGILKNGEWIEDPAMVKAEFLDHFRNRFKQFSGIPPSLNVDTQNRLSLSQSESLEIQFSHEEIKRAVWEYGGDRAPGPDGFSFKFLMTSWDLIKVDVVRFVHEFFLTAFDSLRWDFLDLVMEKLGFGHKWRSWIYGYLHNARSSVLVNGSPTSEFEVFRGLRQGDPLSPFLFILAMEGLHLLTCKAHETGLFKGASVGHGNMIISHLIYADDVIFIGEWSWQNAHNLLCMLRCFYLISGLKINVNKSNIFGVSVSEERVSNMANSIGCGAGIFPIKYLGVPVGCNMTRCANWSVIIKKFSSKLASWKARLLSVGGRLSLIKSVLGHLPTYYMSIYLMPISIQKKLESIRNNFFLGGDVEEKKMTWVRWKKCLASKDLGGLGIGSIFGLNIGLLFKWIWRFFHCSSDLWARVIKIIYGPCGGINDTPGNRLSHSTWGGILSSIKRIKQKGIDLLFYCVRKIGDGTSTRFWEDTWCEDQPLKITFPCIYRLDTDKDCFIINQISLQDLCSSFRRQPHGGAEMTQFLKIQAKIENVVLSDQGDTWKWSVGSATCFSVASVHYLIDSKTLDTALNATRWLRNIPIKVNILIWRLMLNKLPSRVNLDRKSIDVGSILCPICQEDVETINHIFFSCNMAMDLWAKFARWWELDIPICTNISEWFDWLGSLHVSSKIKSIIEGVGGTLLWSIWNFRNRVIFSDPPPKKAVFWDTIVSQSFLRVSSRNLKISLTWVDWLRKPIDYIVFL